MKSFLALLVAMGIMVTLGDGYCFSKINTPGKDDKGCTLDGKLYPFGQIERTENCFRCNCSPHLMSCCSLFRTPTGYDKENCKVVFNKESCDYDVVNKDNPLSKCFVYSRVG